MSSRLIIAASEQCADLQYLSGFLACDPFLWFQPEGDKPYLVVSELEIGRARKQAKADQNILSFGEFKKLAGFAADALSVTLLQSFAAFAIQHGWKQWQVPANFHLNLERKLSRLGLELLTSDAPFCPERRVKSPQEILCLQQALRIAEAGLNRGLEVLRQTEIGTDGLLRWHGEILLAETLRGEIDCEIARRGGIAKDTITAPGIQSADPHQCGYGPIPANQPIVMDIFPRDSATGYFGDLTRTVVRGTATPQLHQAYQTVQQAQQLVFSLLKPGARGKEIHQAVVDFFSRQGYPTSFQGTPHGFFHGTGHSLGLEIHEAPSLNARDDSPLIPGNAVTVEPGLYYPEWGGIRLEDVAVLTASGAENLTLAPFGLEI